MIKLDDRLIDKHPNDFPELRESSGLAGLAASIKWRYGPQRKLA
jgi:hypothetical protein